MFPTPRPLTHHVVHRAQSVLRQSSWLNTRILILPLLGYCLAKVMKFKKENKSAMLICDSASNICHRFVLALWPWKWSLKQYIYIYIKKRWCSDAFCIFSKTILQTKFDWSSLSTEIGNLNTVFFLGYLKTELVIVYTKNSEFAYNTFILSLIRTTLPSPSIVFPKFNSPFLCWALNAIT